MKFSIIFSHPASPKTAKPKSPNQQFVFRLSKNILG
ncbi:hypothetical protein MED193_14752 [Roseobacter sp. MED193]|nr:hypothetical protein MED193_14752 [Roseobacter sp. MED193]